ncbi:hypothetical protein ACLOJK_007024, partial [Asimina triloba]
GGPKGCLHGKVLGSSSGTRPSTGGSPVPVPRCSNHRAWAEEYLKKRKRLVKEGGGVFGEAGRGRSSSDFGALSRGGSPSGLIVSSPEASVEPAPLVSTPSSMPVADVEAYTTSPTPAFGRIASEASRREGVEARTAKEQGPLSCCGIDLGENEAPMCCGVLRSTFGEASSCPSHEQLLRRPFDMEVRVLKILGDLLPVQSRGIRKCHALGYAL